ncbi:predicted protein [Sclerotinia sclerotiorum 1980 UF-70]|uniref:Uncharacterized protein n=1 Tax=Sclerotinia sclerotiorum (strain ATCC 18683 / 1980 / Ss-1) TaxID=665079 RepID=A7EFL7_SCLS1|nr:predicted protein [Sclerotinia sclerotiorum 1980 UF-70]EDO01633.1 predicted protein [Sclerotinia sclerotiorum 1980 UF-70]
MHAKRHTVWKGNLDIINTPEGKNVRDCLTFPFPCPILQFSANSRSTWNFYCLTLSVKTQRLYQLST